MAKTRAFAFIGPALWNHFSTSTRSVLLAGGPSTSFRRLKTAFFSFGLSHWERLCLVYTVERRYKNAYIYNTIQIHTDTDVLTDIQTQMDGQTGTDGPTEIDGRTNRDIDGRKDGQTWMEGQTGTDGRKHRHI